MSPTEIFRNN